MADIALGLDHALRRAGDYWELDGLQTLMFALSCLLGGSSEFWMPEFHLMWWNLLISGLMMSAWAAWFYFVVRKNSPVMRWLKARITYPRTGYVALPPRGSVAAAMLKEQEWKRRPEMWMLLPMIFCQLVDTPWFGTVLLIVVTGIVWIATKGKFPFASIFIPGCCLSALLLPFLPISLHHRAGYLFFAFGLLYLLVGTVQLVTYLRRHPVIQA